MVAFEAQAVAADGECGRLLVEEFADAGLAALRVDDGFGKTVRLAPETGGHALFPACADGVECTLACPSPARPIELPEDALEEVVVEDRVEGDVGRLLPALDLRHAGGVGAAQRAVCAVCHIVADEGVGR